MMKQKKKKLPTRPAIGNADLMIADVPMRISLVYQGKMIFEFDQMIDIIFTESTPEGRQNNIKYMHLKQDKRLSIEDALFAMANDEFIGKEKYIAWKLKFPNLRGLEGSDALQIASNRNGEIKYRKHLIK